MTFDIKAGVKRLARRALSNSSSGLAVNAEVHQFNALLDEAKKRYPESIDLQALQSFSDVSGTWKNILTDTIDRLCDALDVVEDDLLGNSPKLSAKFGILRAESQLESDFSEYASESRKLGLLFFDIDYFKALNTEYTETVVDKEILEPFQHFLIDLLHLRGFGYSVGGDEFIVLLRNVDQAETIAFGERLLRETSAHPFKVGSKEAQFTLSIGVSCYPQDGQALCDLRRQANVAENTAKKEGRNRVVHMSQRESGHTHSSGLPVPDVRKFPSDDHSSQLPKFTAASDCSFFAERFAEAFPGIREQTWFSGEEAVKRLTILLKPPLRFSSSNGGEIVPIWWLRFGNSAIEQFEALTKTSVLIDHQEINVNRICAVHSENYKNLFVYLEADPSPPTGLYPRTEAEFDEALRKFGYVWEEYGLFRGTHLVSRAEYDDGSTVIDGAVVPMNGECLLRTRYISKYNLVICPSQSPINDHRFDQHLESYLNRLLTGEDCISDLRNEVRNQKRGSSGFIFEPE